MFFEYRFEEPAFAVRRGATILVRNFTNLGFGDFDVFKGCTFVKAPEKLWDWRTIPPPQQFEKEHLLMNISEMEAGKITSSWPNTPRSFLIEYMHQGYFNEDQEEIEKPQTREEWNGVSYVKYTAHMHPDEEFDTLVQVLAPLTKVSMIVDVEDVPEGKFLAFIRSQSQWRKSCCRHRSPLLSCEHQMPHTV